MCPHLVQGGDGVTQEDEYKSFLASLGGGAPGGGAPPRPPGGGGDGPRHDGLGVHPPAGPGEMISPNMSSC